MRKRLGLAVCSLLVLTVAAAAQVPKQKEEKRTVTMVLDHTVLNLEHEFVPAAEAMPEDKFGFRSHERRVQRRSHLCPADQARGRREL